MPMGMVEQRRSALADPAPARNLARKRIAGQPGIRHGQLAQVGDSWKSVSRESSNFQTTPQDSESKAGGAPQPRKGHMNESGSDKSKLGLCADCRHAQRIESSKGSVFMLCALSNSDPRFPKYPRLPVLACTGYSPQTGGGATEAG